MTTRRLCYALDLKDDPALIAEYERYHAAGAVWPDITASIREAGIVEMQIFRTGNRLFMITEVDPSFDPETKLASDDANPTIQKWEALMETYQQALPWAREGQKWVPMTEVFALSAQ